MKKFIYFIFLFFIQNSICFAQKNDEKQAVLAVVKQLFEGIKTGDSTKIRAVFAPDARLQTIFADKKGKPTIIDDSLTEFLKSVATPHNEIWDERILHYEVKIDGKLAAVWADYTFFLGAKMSHCGVDAFHLFQSEQGWKITQLTDTRRKKDCVVDEKAEINTFIDAWHKAAAVADENIYFGSMDDDAVFIGTDASERWLRDEMKEKYKAVFDRPSAWAFTPKSRTVLLSDDGNYAWFDELLDTWMGVCRGSGVLKYGENGWKIKHYVLSITVPNDSVKDFIELTKKK